MFEIGTINMGQTTSLISPTLKPSITSRGTGRVIRPYVCRDFRACQGVNQTWHNPDFYFHLDERRAIFILGTKARYLIVQIL